MNPGPLGDNLPLFHLSYMTCIALSRFIKSQWWFPGNLCFLGYKNFQHDQTKPSKRIFKYKLSQTIKQGLIFTCNAARAACYKMAFSPSHIQTTIKPPELLVNFLLLTINSNVIFFQWDLGLFEIHMHSLVSGMRSFKPRKGYKWWPWVL